MQETQAHWLTVPQVADMLGCSTQRVYNMIWNHEVPSYRIGRSHKFRPQDIDAYIESRRVDLNPALAIVKVPEEKLEERRKRREEKKAILSTGAGD